MIQQSLTFFSICSKGLKTQVPPKSEGIPGNSVVKNLPANAGATRDGFDLGQERSPGEGNSNPLQYSCLGNPMDRGAWRATVYGVVKSWTRLSGQTTTTKQNLHRDFILFYFIFKLYIIVLVLPNIKMNPPQVYMCSPP